MRSSSFITIPYKQRHFKSHIFKKAQLIENSLYYYQRNKFFSTVKIHLAGLILK